MKQELKARQVMEEISMSKIRAYVGHSICGKMGKDATDEYMKANNQKAINFGHELRRFFGNVEFYVPADHDEFVMIAYRKDYVSIPEILDVDCIILSDCNFMIAYSPDGYISHGMQVEIDHANKSGIPVLVIPDASKNSLGTIHRQVENLMKG